MTRAEAYAVLGINPNCSLPEIEKAYIDNFNKLRLQAQYGNLVSVRNNAQQQMAHLKDAWEYLKKHHVQIPVCPAARPQGFNQPPPIPPAQQFNTTARQPRTNPFGTMPLANRHLAASFIIAGSMMLVVILSSISALGGFKTKPTASLRVFSVPWCYVEIDGKKFGESGQPEPFEIIEGRHTIKLKREGYLLTKNFKLRKGQRILVKAHLDKGIINVIQE